MKKIMGKTLRKYRMDAHLSVKDVVKLLSEEGYTVSEKSLYGWENGSCQPRLETFLSLCLIYGIYDLPKTFLHQNEECI